MKPAPRKTKTRAKSSSVDLTKAVASIFAFAGFTMSTVSAFLAGADSHKALSNAIVALVICYFVGLICGSVVVRVIHEHNEEYEKANPVPDVQSLIRATEEPIEIEPEPDEPAPDAGRGEAAKKL